MSYTGEVVEHEEGVVPSCCLTQKQLYEQGEHGRREWEVEKSKQTKNVLVAFYGLVFPAVWQHHHSSNYLSI